MSTQVTGKEKGIGGQPERRDADGFSATRGVVRGLREIAGLGAIVSDPGQGGVDL